MVVSVSRARSRRQSAVRSAARRPVDVRQADVEQHQVDPLGPADVVERRPPGAGPVHLVALAGQRGGELVADVRVVLDQEQLSHRSSIPPPTTAAAAA